MLATMKSVPSCRAAVPNLVGSRLPALLHSYSSKISPPARRVAAAAAAAPEEAFKEPDWTEGFPAPVQRRVKALYEVQERFGQVNKEFQKEKLALEVKYSKLYAPLFDERAAVVKGTKTVPKFDVADDETEDKGIEDFWVAGLSNLTESGQFITERDADVLRYLEDIRYEIITGEELGFKLLFHFAENPYFTNKVLEKTYIMDDTEELIPKRFIGTKIDWKAGKNVTVEVKKKKTQDKKLKGKAPAAVVTSEEPCDSFFNWFNPPELPENPYDLEQEELESLQDELSYDYDIAAAIKDRLIPRAVYWFTGEAVEEEYYDEGEEYEENQ